MRTEARYQACRRLARYPLFLAGLCFLVGFTLARPHSTRSTNTTMWAVTDPVRLGGLPGRLPDLAGLAPDRPQYIKTHVLQAVGVLFPPLRILLIFHVTYVVVASRAIASQQGFGSTCCTPRRW